MPDRLTQLMAICDAATEGPWEPTITKSGIDRDGKSAKLAREALDAIAKVGEGGDDG